MCIFDVPMEERSRVFMETVLIGWTEINADDFARVVMDTKKLAVNGLADAASFDMSDDAKWLTQLGSLQGYDDATDLLRACERELGFLFYLFLAESSKSLDDFLQRSGLYWVPILGNPGVVCFGGTLKQLLIGCHEGTNVSDGDVVDTFDRVTIILSEAAGLKFVFKRYSRVAVEIGGRKLFRLKLL